MMTLVLVWAMLRPVVEHAVRLHGLGLVRPRRVLRARRLHDGAGPDAFQHHALADDSLRAASSAALRVLLIGFPTFRLRSHYFALAMLAYPLAMLYVFEWLGYQEVTLPMKRETPAAYMQFSDPRVYTFLALGLLIGIILLSQAIERSRFGMALMAIKQNEAAAEAAGINTLALETARHYAQRRHRGGDRGVLCRGAAGRHAAIGVRHAGVGAGAHRHACSAASARCGVR